MLDSPLKVSAIVALALTVNWLLRSRSAALRHWVLAGACCGALLVPVVEVLVAAWDVPFTFAVPTMRPAGRETRAGDAGRAAGTVATTSSPALSWISPRRAESHVALAAAWVWLTWLWIAGAAGS